MDMTVGRPVGTLVSVNVGLPREVAWRGRTVYTGVWKEPVEGPRTVRRLNVDGDGQGDLAGHGGEQRAVLVYQLDSYRYWQRQLGRDDFGYGQFGENFTVDGLPDDEVGIGDRYRIGTARPRPVILAATRRRAASLVCLAPYFAGGVEWPRVMASGVGWGRCGGGSGVGFVAIRVWGWWVVGCGGRGWGVGRPGLAGSVGRWVCGRGGRLHRSRSCRCRGPGWC